MGYKNLQKGIGSILTSEINYKLLVEVAMLAGEIMLCGGAETYRVEDTMTRILKISGFDKTEVYVTPTGIFMTLGDASIDTISLVKRLEMRMTNFSYIYTVNTISRNLCNGKITLEDAYLDLKNIQTSREYGVFAYYICIILASLSFTVLLGGDWLNSILAGFHGGIIVFVFILTKRVQINTFIKNMLASILIAFSSMLFMHVLNLPIQLDALIGGSLMPLLPGVAITNAIRDTLQGDYVSGGARAIEAFITAAATAAGVGVGMAFFAFLSGGNVL